MKLDAKIPGGAIADKWDRHRFEMKLVNPANKRKFTIIVVGTGLAGASAASSLGELGYNVKAFCIHDSPRRAHSIAAQGGINAAKNYRNDGDSVERLFYDTVKGGDYRAREANVYRLAQTSVQIIDQAVAQGVPFAREYGGVLDNRSFGGAQVSRTFYARGQTGQQLLIGAYQSLMRQVEAGTVTLFPNREMLDLVLVDGKARGIIVRNLLTGELESHVADAVCLATGGYGTAYYLSTNAVNSNVTAAWRCYKRGALFANPCFTQIHPTCIPVSGEHQSKLTLMSESLRNDGRVWVPKTGGDKRPPQQIPEAERDYYLERRYPSFGNLVPRDVASRAAKAVCDEGRGVGETQLSRLSRLRRRHPPRRRGHRARALRQPVPDVREDHRRGSVQGADADLPRRPLHDGRPVGGLQPDEHRPGPARAGRGQLLRPRRQPPRRQRPDAGPGRRLLRHPGDHRPLPRQHAAAEGHRPITTRSRRPRPRCSARIGSDARQQGHAHRARAAPRAGPHPVGLRRHGPHRGRAAHRAGQDPAAARGVLAERLDSRRAATPSTRTSSTPAASPTTWSSARCWRWTRSNGANRAAATSARNTRRPTTKPGATTSSFAHVAAWEYRGPDQAPVRHIEPLEFEHVHPTQRSYK